MQYALRLNKIIFFVWLGHQDHVLIIEESIIADETPLAFIRQISLKIMVDAQLSRLSSVFDSCFLCSIVVPWIKDSRCRNHGGNGEVVFVVVMN